MKITPQPEPFIGWSNFALERHKPGTGHTYLAKGSPDEVINRVKENWPLRRPGYGRKDLLEVVVVPIQALDFVGNLGTAKPGDAYKAAVTKRRENEESYIEVVGQAQPDPIRFVNVVLYSKATLQDSGEELSGNFDWEIVAITASSVENEPMHPTTMARNFLKKEGGTYAPYTADDFAQAIWYWKDKVKLEPKPPEIC